MRRSRNRSRKEYTLSAALPIPSEQLSDFCRRHHIRRLALFGSTAWGTARADSDIDLLVEFEPGHIPGLFALSDMESELSDLLGGRAVDLRTIGDLSRYFRDDVARRAVVQYAA